MDFFDVFRFPGPGNASENVVNSVSHERTIVPERITGKVLVHNRRFAFTKLSRQKWINRQNGRPFFQNGTGCRNQLHLPEEAFFTVGMNPDHTGSLVNAEL